jgi:hypothetical protein
MRKFIVLFAIICLGLNGFSQEPSLPNGNFEAWSLYYPGSVPPIPPYYEPDGGFFHTLNILDTIPYISPGVSVYRCDTSHRGNYSARCITRTMPVGTINVVIPGVIGNLKIDFPKNIAVLGEKFTWTTKPERFQGWYQSYPVADDSTGAIILLSKWNAGTQMRDTIAYNRLVFKGKVASWTQFDTAIYYSDNVSTPDSITILLLSCAGYNATYMLGSVGQVGTQALFDDVTITNVAGIEYIFHPSVDVKISPNPASSFINVAFDKVLKSGSFEVYDAVGRKVAEFAISALHEQFSVGNLKTGVYYYRVRNEGEVANTGSFTVSR